MSTRLHLKCDGCDAETHTERITRTFQSFNGRGYGFGRYHYPSIDDVVTPTGWVWSDPYTGCTYCPTCWKEIDSEQVDAAHEGAE